MKLEDLLIEHGKRKHIGRLELDATGVCSLIVNGTYVVSFEKSLDGKGFYLYGVVDTLSDDHAQELALSLLTSNLFGRETGRCSLGYEPSNHSLILFAYIEEESTDFNTYYRQFENFVTYLSYWIEKVDQMKAHPAGQGAGKPTPITDADGHKKIFYG